MSVDEISRREENCTENSEDCTDTKTVQEAKTLKEKIFLVCNKIENSGGKVTRALVREQTGGSDRDLSRYIAEWRESLIPESTPDNVPEHTGKTEALTVREEGKVSKNSGTNTQKSEYSDTPSSDLEAIARRGAERAAALLIGEDAVMYHLLENPDRLPEDLRQQVEGFKTRNNERTEQRQKQYKPDFFVEAALAKALS